MYLDFSPKELRHCVHIVESGTCDLDKQPLGDRCDTYRDYLREDQVESQAVSVPKMSRYKGMCTSGGCDAHRKLLTKTKGKYPLVFQFNSFFLSA
ncbi:hypothetical protein Bca52824_093230 [Brassica carinata]|uniref:Uncharacterized protein n=1 Tax=Brassica carinata TaxID=52824 RepID=A0A8X7P635_BRACI|nr:hypothetical protein Bca52824_093230 [Brassica carinata]